MKRMGWTEDGEFCWKHEVIKEKLEIKVTVKTAEKLSTLMKGRKKKIAHQVREGFRCWQWQKFGNQSKRHEVKQIRDELTHRIGNNESSGAGNAELAAPDGGGLLEDAGDARPRLWMDYTLSN